MCHSSTHFKKVFYLCFTVLLAVGCRSKAVNLGIDNPTGVKVSLYIDSLYVEVPPTEIVWVEMGKGIHEIKLADTSLLFDFSQDEYMINPTRSEYLLTGEELGSPGPDVPKYPAKKVNYSGYPLTGNYEVLNNIILPVRWKYGPRQDIPAELYADDEPRIIYKLNDFNDFMERLASGYDQSDEIEELRPTENDSAYMMDSLIVPSKLKP